MLQSKEQLITELKRIDDLILIYSAMDMVRVKQLAANKTALEAILMDIMSRENDTWLATIKASDKAIRASKKK